VPPARGEPRVAALELLHERHPVEDRDVRDRLGRVERQPLRDAAAAVMAGDGEALVAEVRHQREDVARHRALGVRRVVGGGRRAARLAVAAQVGADDGVALGQQRRHAVARSCACADGRGAGPPAGRRQPVANADRRVTRVDALEREAVEEHAFDHSRFRETETSEIAEDVQPDGVERLLCLDVELGELARDQQMPIADQDQPGDGRDDQVAVAQPAERPRSRA
jgi:hypothetical protein